MCRAWPLLTMYCAQLCVCGRCCQDAGHVSSDLGSFVLVRSWFVERVVPQTRKCCAPATQKVPGPHARIGAHGDRHAWAEAGHSRLGAACAGPPQAGPHLPPAPAYAAAGAGADLPQALAMLHALPPPLRGCLLEAARLCGRAAGGAQANLLSLHWAAQARPRAFLTLPNPNPPCAPGAPRAGRRGCRMRPSQHVLSVQRAPAPALAGRRHRRGLQATWRRLSALPAHEQGRTSVRPRALSAARRARRRARPSTQWRRRRLRLPPWTRARCTGPEALARATTWRRPTRF